MTISEIISKLEDAINDDNIDQDVKTIIVEGDKIDIILNEEEEEVQWQLFRYPKEEDEK